MNIFFSYRRNDTQDLAGRLADRLREVPDIRNVFLDVEEIAPGTDFSARIRDALSRDPACLIMIGNTWLGERPSGPPRITDDMDFVRMAAAAALGSGFRVIPVLANGAAMPSKASLPDDLQRLPALNAVSLRHAYFDHDANFLIETLLQQKKPGAIATYFRNHPIHAALLRGFVGFVVAALLILMVVVVHRALLGRSLDATLGGPGPVWMTVMVTLAAGTVAGVLARKRWRKRRSSP